jgi:ribonuclease G
VRVENRILVNHTDELTRVAVVESGVLSEIHLEPARERRIVGNIYKARVMRVLPGMNAAFVDAGLERTGFLYATDVTGRRGFEDAPAEEEESTQERADRTDVRIETLVREGQDILVQVAKEPIGSKGARLTCQFSMPGVLGVLMPTVDHVGISRRIEDPEERQRLRDIGDAVRPAGVGLILRTVAEGRSADEIRSEVQFLHQIWTQVKQGADAVDAPALLHEDMHLLLRTARDLICRRFDRLVVDSEDGYRQVKNFVARFLPSFAPRVEHYTGRESLFEHFGIEYEIARAVQRKVWLKSGGYIVLDRTEAFTAVDVNSGKFTGKNDPEETILKTNMEAAVEIAYQLRLRNIGGIIVIDFIDMKEKENRHQVHSTLVEELRKDYARARVLPMSDLGLVEMTRKRVAESVMTRLTEPCFYCEGKGYLKSPDMIVHMLMDKLRKEMAASRAKTLHAHANPRICQMLMENCGPALEKLEKRQKKTIVLTERPEFHLEQFEVFGEK